MGDDEKELTIHIHPDVLKDVAGDPEAEAAMKDFLARMRQAYDATERGQYRTIDEALQAVGIEARKLDVETGEEIKGASLQDDLERAGIIEQDDDDEC